MWLELHEHGPSTTLEVKKNSTRRPRALITVYGMVSRRRCPSCEDQTMKLLLARCKILEIHKCPVCSSSINKVGWPNGKALDYESRDCRFDPCVDQQHYNHPALGARPFVLLFFPIFAKIVVEGIRGAEFEGSIPA